MRKIFTLLVTAALAFSVSALNLNMEGKNLHETATVHKQLTKNHAVSVNKAKVDASGVVAKKKGKMHANAQDGVSIEGTWTFALGDYYFQNSTLTTLEKDLVATLNGTTLTFIDESNDMLPMVATFNEADGTVSFSKMSLGSTGSYYIYQEPFVYNYDTEELDDATVVGQFDAQKGTITFEPDNGMAWHAYTNAAGTVNAGYFGIYDLEGAEKGIEWIAMENGTYLDNICYSNFFKAPNNINTKYEEVTVLENPLQPGVYKVKEPFKTFYDIQGWDGCPAMIIDASDPDNVLISRQGMGFGDGEGGSYSYFSNSWYQQEYGQALGGTAVKITKTTNENGEVTITIPARSCFLAISGSTSAYYIAAESVLKFSEPKEEVELDYNITGNATSQIDEWQGMDDEPQLLDPETYAVKAAFEDGKLTLLNNKAADAEGSTMFDMPLTFVVNAEEGTAVSEEDQVAYVQEPEEEGDPTIEYLYTDIATGTTVLKATLCNLSQEPAKSRLTIEPFGEGFFWEDYEMMFYNVAYYNTVVELDYYFEGAPDYVEPASIEVTNVTATDIEDVTANINVTYEAANVPENGKVYVTLTGDGIETVEQEADEVVTTIQLTGLNAETDYTVSATATVKVDEEVVATSEAVEVSFKTLEAVASQPTTDKAHYVYDLKAEKGGNDIYTLTFGSTGDAAKAVLVLTEATSGEEIEEELGSVVKGENSFTYNASELNAENKYNWAIRVHNYAIPETKISEVTAVGGNRAGLATFTDPEYPEVYGYTVIGRTQNGGIDVYNPEGELVSSAIYPKTAAMGGTSANTSCPMDATTRGTEVYLASWGDAAYGIVAFDLAAELAEAGSATPYSVFDGTKASSGAVYNSSDELIGSGTPCVGVWGEGEETTLIFFNEDNYGDFTSYANVLAMNVIGNGKTTSNAIQLVGTGYKAELLNTNVGVATVEKGIFASQVRGNGMETSTSGLRYFARTEEGNFTSVWRASDQAEEYPTLLPSSVAGVDVNPAGDKIAVATYTGINVYGLTWEEQDVYTTGDDPEFVGTFDIPHLTPELSINYPFGNVTTRTNVRFDAGGNIHAVQQANGYFTITFADEEPVSLTNAPTTSFIAGTSGVENVAVGSDNEGDAIYYNLNGVRVEGKNLPAGIYVKVIGNKATKVVVK